MTNEKRTAKTLDDVARLAGVSKYTVSAVLNRTQSNTRVSEQTRLRIEAAAAELSYRPNAIAVSLRKRKTDLIGFYNAYEGVDMRNRFLAEILAGVQAGCEAYDKDIVLFRVLRQQSVEHVYNALADGRVDGLILYAPSDDALARRLAESHMPAVAVADSLPSLPSVVADDYGGGVLQARHLAERGHRQIFYRASWHSTRSITSRLDGFLESARLLGMTVRVIAADPSVGWSEEERVLLTSPGAMRPTAAVCWEDWHADQLMVACKQHGLRIPEDVAIVGFDGLEPALTPTMRLTTVRVPWLQVAETAVGVLLDQIGGKSVEAETVLPVDLIAGDTT